MSKGVNPWLNALWWIAFIAVSIAVQALAPGLDVLVVGLIILLQEKDYKAMLWLCPLFILLQEGIGTRPFGSVLVWYAAVFAMFKLGRWLFETGNFVFIALLSACLGGAYFGVAWLVAPLQNLDFNVGDALDKSIVQAIFMPFAWRMLTAMRPQPQNEEETG